MAAIAAAIAVGGCDGAESHPTAGDDAERDQVEVVGPNESRMAKLGLTVDLPTNLLEACEDAAEATALDAVHCPPIVPDSRTRITHAGLSGGESTYSLNLISEGLPGRGKDFADGHWLIVADRSPGRLWRNLSRWESRPRVHGVTLDGVRARVVTGAGFGTGVASQDHVIVLWEFADTGYLVSVHWDENRRIAIEIARGLINQMVACIRDATDDRESSVCDGVVVASA